MKWLPFKLTEQEKQALKEAGGDKSFKSFQVKAIFFAILIIAETILLWRHYQLLLLLIAGEASVFSAMYAGALKELKIPASLREKIDTEIEKQEREQKNALKFRPKILLFVALPLVLLLIGTVVYILYSANQEREKMVYELNAINQVGQDVVKDEINQEAPEAVISEETGLKRPSQITKEDMLIELKRLDVNDPIRLRYEAMFPELKNDRLIAWRVYRNDKHGFAIRYPDNMEISDRILSVVRYDKETDLTGPGSYWLNIDKQRWLNRLKHKDIYSVGDKCVYPDDVEPITEDNVKDVNCSIFELEKAYVIRYVDRDSFDYIIIGNDFEATFSFVGEKDKIFRDMLSTFRFLE